MLPVALLPWHSLPPSKFAQLALCVQVYTPARIAALLEELRGEVHLLLLFLKCVERVEVLQWREGEQEVRPRQGQQSASSQAARNKELGCTCDSNLGAACIHPPLYHCAQICNSKRSVSELLLCCSRRCYTAAHCGG